VDPTEAGQWESSEVDAVAAVVAAVFVEAVVMSNVVVGVVTVVVVVVVVVVAVAVAAAAAAAVVVAVAAVAAQQEWASYVGAYDLGGTDHFWVMFDADNPVSERNNIAREISGVPPHQEKCYSVFHVEAWTTALAAVVP
jgi:hypothetical protein